MKKIVFFFVLVTFSVMTSFAQKNDKVKSEEIKTIKTNFSRINSIKKWSKIATYETDDSAEGGYINYYYLNGKLEKIVERKFGESGQYLAEYYLQNNKISFLFEKDMTYNFPLYWKEFDYNKSEIEENRYYFENKELIHFIGKSTNSKTESKDTLDKFEELINMEKSYRN